MTYFQNGYKILNASFMRLPGYVTIEISDAQEV